MLTRIGRRIGLAVFAAAVGSAIVGSAIVGSAAPASAHHSYAGFDRESSVTIEGVIEEIDWANPHVRIAFRTDDGATYLATWWDLTRLRRSGVAASPFSVGDRIVVEGAPNLDPEVREVTLITAVRRPADGWSWRRTWFRNNGAAVEAPDSR